MEILTYVGMFVASIAVLLKASDWFVDAAERIGLSWGVSPFIIGVTIVAFGTSLPELASSISAVAAGESAIVAGNVIGSNIANILLVLGLTAIIAKKVEIGGSIMNIDMPLLLGSSFFLWFAISDGNFTIFEAILFLTALALFLVGSFSGDKDKDSLRSKASMKDYGMLLLGGILVKFGADYTIQAIQALSEIAGIDPDIIAVTAVAIATSLPEVIVSIGAARKGKPDIAVGNVLGSNLFNTYAVMAIPSFFGTLEITPTMIQFGLPFMVAMTVLFAIICITNRISRWEGYLLILFYILFMYKQLELAGFV